MVIKRHRCSDTTPRAALLDWLQLLVTTNLGSAPVLLPPATHVLPALRKERVPPGMWHPLVIESVFHCILTVVRRSAGPGCQAAVPTCAFQQPQTCHCGLRSGFRPACLSTRTCRTLTCRCLAALRRICEPS